VTTPAPPPVEPDQLTVEQPGNFDIIPTHLWLGGAVSAGALAVYIAIRRRGTMSKGKAIPSRQVIARDTGLTKRTVDAKLDELVEKGWLLITPRVRPDGKGQTSNHYTLLWTPIDSAADPRLVAHQKRVGEVAAWMDRWASGSAGERSVRTAAWSADAVQARTTAVTAALRGTPDDPEQNLHGVPAIPDPAQNLYGPPGARIDTGPVQETTPLEPVTLEPTHTKIKTPTADAAAMLPITDGDGATQPAAATVSKAEREPQVEAVLADARQVVTEYMDWWKKLRGLPKELAIPNGDRAYNALVGVRPKRRNCSYVTAALAQGYTPVQVKKALAMWANPDRGRAPSGLVPPPGTWTELLTAVAADRTPPSGRPQRTAAYSDQKWVDDPTGGWGPQPTAAGGQA